MRVQMNETLRACIERRAQSDPGLLSVRVERVLVQIVDLDGSRGGADKSLRIGVRLRPTERFFVEDTDAELMDAADVAIDRAARLVTRANERTRGIVRDARSVAHSPPACAARASMNHSPRGGEEPSARHERKP